MPRKPSSEEIDLWKKHIQDVKPLVKAKEKLEKAKSPKPTFKVHPRQESLVNKKKALPLPPQSFGRKEARHTKFEAQIDLHGMNFEEAQRALRKFLLRSQEEGFKTVLIITGKGPREAERTLKRYLPRWLEETPLRELIISFHYPAKPQHGGEGAYYLKVRQLKDKR